jgi:hypothetical protein
VISREVWPYSEVRARWDELVLCSWVGEGASRRRYQEGALAEMLRPEDLEALVRDRVGGELEGSVIFSGTLPIVDGGGFGFGGPFAVELEDPSSGGKLGFEYVVRETALTDDA